MNTPRPLSSFRNATPFPYLGGKSRMVNTIIPLLPPHTTYIEPFSGAANILLAKKPSQVEVLNDESGLLVNFFRVLQDPIQSAALLDRLEYTPYARMEYALALERLDDPDPVMKAWAFFTAQCQGISGGGSLGGRNANNWGYSRTADQAQSFRGHVEKLPAIAERLLEVQIEHSDGVEVIRRWDAPDTLFYIDPPYADSTRTNKKGCAAYHCEIDDDGQQTLVDALLRLQGGAILSGYRTTLYRPLEDAGWERREFAVDLSAAARVRTFNAMSAAGKERHKRIECLWLSPDVAAAAARSQQCGLFEALSGEMVGAP
ncbi:DNA adenine methylase [Acidithiobacillus ferriphilus]|jgi:DNA adenine methylase|uniref:DNA adenine methylase n=1 Tax=Acidithiobacillus ferriphilus TaxID=1689834 RepID=UPI001C07BEB7|nr:DNA adenine methylase [Acidithiobacillus ferriphilus]MBU2827841.1 DNA adenine methylase [Acidithiobacillus ferriphilus]MBU2845591.1 DNA adenine methylase [Acidithiobacillus ferriphilus]